MPGATINPSRFNAWALRTKVLRGISIYWAGGLTAALYLHTAVFYRQGFQVPSQTARELFAWFSIVPLLFFFWAGYEFLGRSPERAKVGTVAGFAALFGILAFLIFPFHSEDIFAYINTGWQQVQYGQNPYVRLVAEIPGWQQDPMFWKSWAHTPPSYGFLFTMLARFVAWVGHGGWLATVYLFKLTNLAAYGATAWLVWAGANRLRLGRPVAALYLFAWNPLVLMHEIANGHNDILAGCFIALGAYLATMGAAAEADFWIIPALAMAALIKDVPAVMIPFALLLVAKRKGWTTAALSCATAAALGVAASWPYLADWRQIRVGAIVAAITFPEGSLHAALISLFGDAARVIPALSPWRGALNAAIGATLEIGSLIFFVALLVRMGKRMATMPAAQLTGEFLQQSLLALTVLLCVADGRFEAWYLAMLLPQALFLEETHWLRRLVVALTIGEFFSLTFLRSAFVINYIAMVIVPAWIVFAQWQRPTGSTLDEPAPSTLAS